MEPEICYVVHHSMFRYFKQTNIKELNLSYLIFLDLLTFSLLLHNFLFLFCHQGRLDLLVLMALRVSFKLQDHVFSAQCLKTDKTF